MNYRDLSERDKQSTVLSRLDDARVAIENMPAGSGPIEYAIDENGVISKATVNFKLPSNAKDLGPYTFYYAFTNSDAVKTVDLSSLTEISGNNGADRMFSGCTNLTSVDLSSLTTISGNNGANYMFNGCPRIESIDLSSLTTISGSYGTQYMFSNNGFTSIDLSSLTTISGNNGAAYMFYYCSNLTSVDLSSLTTISGNGALSSTFRSCSKLKELRFPAITADSFGSSYTNQLASMLSGVTGCTVHFPAAAQAKIETMAGYPNFGGTNTTVLFDL